MLKVKGIYENDEVKLLEPVNVKGRYIVEIRFIETESAKSQQIEAFKKARGIWKDRPDVDIAFEEMDRRWEQWRTKLEESV